MALTIVGLGPGEWEQLTVEAASTLRDAQVVYVRSGVHPDIEPIRRRLPSTEIRTFDDLYDALPTLDQVYESIADRIADLAQESDVVYAVPGSPMLGDTSVRLLLSRLRDIVPVHIVSGISHMEPVLAAVGAAGASWLQIVDAVEAALLGSENGVGEVENETERLPWRSPVATAPLLISYLYDRRIASGVKLWLGRFYPDEHEVALVQNPGTTLCEVRRFPLFELDRQGDIGHRTALYVPPLAETENARTFAGLMQLTRTLRAPGGCPWDREQTHATLKTHLLEETYEVLDALDSGEPALLAEELGDLLFQITIHSQIATEQDEFTIEDVIQNVMTKLIGRHPHVFAGLNLDSAQDVRQAWESFKQAEKPKRASVLEEIPRGMPALPQSNLMQKRAANVGFEWPTVGEVLDKVEEEVRELRQEIDAGASRERRREELGDILFALVSVARHLKIDPEEALRLANRKFADRFRFIESRASVTGTGLRDLSSETLNALWEEAKAQGAPSA